MNSEPQNGEQLGGATPEQGGGAHQPASPSASQGSQTGKIVTPITVGAAKPGDRTAGGDPPSAAGKGTPPSASANPSWFDFCVALFMLLATNNPAQSAPAPDRHQNGSSPQTPPGAPPDTASNSGGKTPTEDTAADAKEIAKLALQVEEHYDSCRNSARWHAFLFALFICSAVLLAVAFALSFLIAYQGEILTPGDFISNIVTWRNVRVVIGAALILILLTIFAAGFYSRRTLYQHTLTELAKLRIDLTDPASKPKALREKLIEILDDHHGALKGQQKKIHVPQPITSGPPPDARNTDGK